MLHTNKNSDIYTFLQLLPFVYEMHHFLLYIYFLYKFPVHNTKGIHLTKVFEQEEWHKCYSSVGFVRYVNALGTKRDSLEW